MFALGIITQLFLPAMVNQYNGTLHVNNKNYEIQSVACRAYCKEITRKPSQKTIKKSISSLQAVAFTYQVVCRFSQSESAFVFRPTLSF